jgi:starvation-inducible DNA-binding protein
MDDLIQQMKVCLASTFAFYLKAHNFHWNVEGPNFPQYHELFSGVYEDAFGAVDVIAEQIRTLGSYAPGSLSRFSTLSIIDEQLNIPEARKMVVELESDNKNLIDQLVKTYALAEKYNRLAISNFLQDRIQAHEKQGWQLRATSK